MSIKDLTTEELLESVGKAKPTVFNFSNENKSIRDFIQDLGIADGKTRVPGHRLYYEYRKLWRPTGVKITKIDFLRRFNRYFKVQRTKSTRYYMLKRGIFSLDKDIIDNAKKFDERYENKIRKKREQKIKGKVPSTE
jgi:hypothetical protein